MAIKLINLLLILFLLSCSGSTENTEQKIISADTTHYDNEKIIEDNSNQEFEVPEGWIEVEIGEITFLIEEIEMVWGPTSTWDDRMVEFQDTARFDLLAGSNWMNDKQIKIKGDEFEITEMYVQEVTTIGVDSERVIEVPFCALSRWKKSRSNWIQIQAVNNEFRFKEPDNFDTQPFNVELDELKGAIKNSCGNEWFEEFKDVDSLNQIEYYEFTSQYNYKIVLEDKNSERLVERVIIFSTPISC